MAVTVFHPQRFSLSFGLISAWRGSNAPSDCHYSGSRRRAAQRLRIRPPQHVDVRHVESRGDRRQGREARVDEPAYVSGHRNQGAGRQTSDRRRRRRRHHAGDGRRFEARGPNARHSGRRPRQSESQRLGQASAHPRRHDSRRRDPSVLCGQHAHASVDASGEHRGTLGAEPRLDRRRVRGDGGFPAERRRKGDSGEATLATVCATSSRPRSAPYSTSCVRSTSARTKS